MAHKPPQPPIQWTKKKWINPPGPLLKPLPFSVFSSARASSKCSLPRSRQRSFSLVWHPGSNCSMLYSGASQEKLRLEGTCIKSWLSMCIYCRNISTYTVEIIYVCNRLPLPVAQVFGYPSSVVLAETNAWSAKLKTWVLLDVAWPCP